MFTRRFFVCGAGHGVVVSDVIVSDYETKLDAFIARSEPFFHSGALRHLVMFETSAAFVVCC